LKKLFNSAKWKRHSASRTRAQSKRRVPGRRVLRCPKIFSLIWNPEKTIKFLNVVRSQDSRYPTLLNLARTILITPEAIASLLAACQERGIRIQLSRHGLPVDRMARRVLEQAGFGPHHGTFGRRFNSFIFLGYSSNHVSGNSYDPLVPSQLIEWATEKLGGTPRKHGPTFTILSEAMHNTTEHASPSGSQNIPWWASAYHDRDEGKVCFTFVDFGVGIFRSHRLSALLRLRAAVTQVDNAEILHMIFQGLVPSSTGFPNRGNGIPTMYARCKSGLIRNLIVVANDAMGEAEPDRYRILRNEFAGTVVYWEVQYAD
jgi:hypothetical protein